MSLAEYSVMIALLGAMGGFLVGIHLATLFPGLFNVGDREKCER
jgi:hypothetical protein